MPRDSDTRWQPPDRLAPGKTRFGWTDEIIQDGERWLQTQSFWNDLTKAENLIRGKEALKADENRSDLTSNRLKRILREMSAAISDVRYPDAWGSDNKAYQDEATMFSKTAKGVWYESRAALSLRQAAQWMVLGGNANIWPVFRRRKLVDPTSTAICFDAYGPRDVVPFMMPQDNNIQGCYAVTIVRMMSLPEAHARFPKFQDKLKAVSKKRMQSDVVQARAAFIASLRGQNRSLPWSEQLCEIRYTLIRDLAINQTGMPIPMGDAGASWSYVVPSMGADMPTDEVINGERKMRPAGIDDCRLYPNMRLMVTGSGVDEPMVDGPAWDWHGMFPPRFFADDWVTDPMGFSLIRDVLDLERTRQFTERAVDMKVKAQMDPGMIYDQTKINPATAEELDAWEMRKRLGVDGEADEKTLRPMLPAEWYKLGSDPFEWLKYLAASEDEQLGVNQMSALAKAKMSVGAESGVEDLLRIAGPIVRDISAAMEPPMADVLEMVKYQILQFFDTGRIMTYVGPDGVTPVTFDFDPHSLVPSHMPGEDPEGGSKFSRMERAKNFARNLRLHVAPGSVHGLTQTQQKLLLLQGSRAGLPISPRRILREVFGIENFDQEFKEWFDVKKLELEFAAKLKQEGGSLPGLQAAPTAEQAKGAGGRPPKGNKPPAAKTQGTAEGPRTKISESG